MEFLSILSGQVVWLVLTVILGALGLKDLYDRGRTVRPFLLLAGAAVTLLAGTVLSFYEMQRQRDEALRELAIERSVPAKKRISDLA